MSIEVLTTEDLKEFKTELLSEIKQLILSQDVTQTKQWLKTKEVLKILRISPNTLTNMRISGDLPATKIGGIYYYSYQDIQQMLLQNKQSF
ncbi:helix-turn-helix domain-containing protein [Carboxylicivirga sp. A043]|uniref:helix-turn-helix domain-containing protein n=1 Tax=Carboxylicivirga litoralis TaxID=2816963 RepID=UPI0021CB73B9|nr:helix-turn-helix domain-containing protein [Carboxylicivirga sp. A043]MCU4157779.1 helix-turn-helix domain-containing protein [Carboxylicivirga sp. A043]